MKILRKDGFCQVVDGSGEIIFIGHFDECKAFIAGAAYLHKQF